jgi:hypothetical protein
MARSQLFPSVIATHGRRLPAKVWGSVTLGSSGAIASTTGFWASKAATIFGVVKTASKTGRYSFTMDRTYRTLRVTGVSIVGPTDAAFGNTNANAIQVRNQTTSSFDLQLFLASSGADTDGASGTVINVEVQVEMQGGKD